MLIEPHSQSFVRTERRRYQRIAVRCNCWLSSDRVTLYATTLDLGPGGLFLRTAVPMPRGYEVSLELTPDDPDRCDGAILAHGIVARAVPAARSIRPGLGLRFLDIEHGDTALQQLLELG